MSELEQNPTLEVGHVLVVGLARNATSSPDQTQALHQLQQVVDSNSEIHSSLATGDLIEQLSDDCLALIFFQDPASPLRSAVHIAEQLQNTEPRNVRMGVHSGPVYRAVNDNSLQNVLGDGVNYAQCVMDCGDTGHILVSKSTADLLGPSNEWRKSLHELGRSELESGLRVHLFNCYTGDVGNSNAPTRFRATPLAQQTPPKLIDGRYRILGKLGEGGMGQVYEADDTRLGRHVAVKLLTTPNDNEHYRNRFYREARAASKLNHPNIATVHDYGTTSEGQPYIVMELVSGKTLADILEDGPLRIERTVEIISDVAQALREAHHRGIIHRDIKPSNVVVSSNGRVKVLDFGLAKEIKPELSDQQTQIGAVPVARTLSGVVVGTPLYLSPEQARGVAVDQRSDLFALGSLLYECLTGRAAFAGGSVIEVCTQVIHYEPPPPSKVNSLVPPELDRINQRALTKDPDARYQSAEEVWNDLRALQNGLNEFASASTKHFLPVSDRPQDRLLSYVRNPKRLAVVAASIALLAIGTWAVVHYWRTRVSSQHSAEAQYWYDLGTESLRDGAYFQASKRLEQAVNNNNNFALAHARLAEALMELDVTDRARQEMLKAEEGRDNLDHLDQLHFDAIKATVQRDFPKAVEAYSALQQGSSDQRGIYVDLGRAYDKNEDIDKAIASYEQAIKLNSHEAAAFLGLGILYGRKHEQDKALASFDKAQSLYVATSNNEGEAEVLYQRGSFYNLISNYKEAQANLQRALDKAKDNTYQQIRVMLQMSLVACFMGEPAQSQQYANQSLDMARANAFNVLQAQALVGLGSSYYCAGSNAEAEKNFTEGLSLAHRYEALSTEAKARLSLGSLQISQNRTDEALKNVELALAFYQKRGGYLEQTMNAQAIIGRGSLNKGEYQTAIQAFQDLLNKADSLKDLDHIAFGREGLGNTLIALERYPEALAQFQESLKANEAKNDKLGTGYNLSNCAKTLWRLGRYAEADAMFDRASEIAKHPEEYKNILLEVQINRMEEMLSMRDFQQVEQFANRVVEIADPKDPDPLIKVRRAVALAKLWTGKANDAKSLCEEAVGKAVDLGDPSLLYSARSALAEILLETKDASKALGIVSADLNHLSSTGKQESLWRSYLLSARASRQLNDESGARNYANQAREVLKQLEQSWGTEAFNKYASRSDIREYLAHLQKLPA